MTELPCDHVEIYSVDRLSKKIHRRLFLSFTSGIDLNNLGEEDDLHSFPVITFVRPT